LGTNLAQFNRALKAASKEFLEQNLIKFHKAVCIETLKRIVLRTPVDPGRARGNWQIEINQPASGVYDYEGDEGSATNEVFNRELGKLASIPAFSVVHLTNNIEYIYYLEYVRRSDQHPDGMVEITLEEMRTWVSGLFQT
jgi:hypothetical protein